MREEINGDNMKITIIHGQSHKGIFRPLRLQMDGTLSERIHVMWNIGRQRAGQEKETLEMILRQD